MKALTIADAWPLARQGERGVGVKADPAVPVAVAVALLETETLDVIDEGEDGVVVAAADELELEVIDEGEEDVVAAADELG